MVANEEIAGLRMYRPLIRKLWNVTPSTIRVSSKPLMTDGLSQVPVNVMFSKRMFSTRLPGHGLYFGFW
jgi:hypothetical protein